MGTLTDINARLLVVQQEANAVLQSLRDAMREERTAAAAVENLRDRAYELTKRLTAMQAEAEAVLNNEIEALRAATQEPIEELSVTEYAPPGQGAGAEPANEEAG